MSARDGARWADPKPCEICGGPIRSDNKYGVCARNPECEQERNRRYCEAHREQKKSYERQRSADYSTEAVERARQWNETDPFRPARRSWSMMIRRCYNVDSPAWTAYGGNGIIVCERWRIPGGTGFKNFLTDLGERPVDNPATSRTSTGKVVYQTLGRYHDRGNYEPGNCEWMTWERQARHKAPHNGTSSVFKGVYWAQHGAWAARIGHRHLGYFTIEAEAARTYDAAARAAWDTDCWMNFP